VTRGNYDWQRRATVREFPSYGSHGDVECFNCGEATGGEPLDTEYPDGVGRFRQTCPACGYHTYYDLRDGRKEEG